ncbi:hypothetical protein PIB30_025861 [Stylosanthes scabra]|uniref:R13L1/DRL21-like LRR repeat region domain-containing protein n=1 Tax=Stylosanthes scabra TaxID=79078 RepID=A0ABU6W9U8_9FABA|nr:hypothetical protein [Stylosanthes scabra]
MSEKDGIDSLVLRWSSEARMSEKDGIDSLALDWSWYAYKNIIDSLMLEWDEDNNIVDLQIENDILDKLRPHSNLKVLRIEGYRGKRFPDWLGNSSYHNITKVSLDRCRNCRTLPSLGQLPSLKRLEISDFSSVETVGDEFYRSDESCLETPFPMLETLSFYNVPCWKEWRCSSDFNALPRLRELSIWECPMLRGDLPNQLPSLQSLQIQNCEQLTSSGVHGRGHYCRKLEFQMDGQHHSLQELFIWDSCDSVTSLLLDSFPKLVRVSIGGCKKMETVVVSRSLSCLRSLNIQNCGSLKSASTLWMLAPQLKDLILLGCPEIELSATGYPHSSLRFLSISYSEELVSSAAFMNSQFHGLSHLVIDGKDDKSESVKCLPKEGWLPPSLESLELNDIKSVETLECKGLAHLTSLQQLSIDDCPKLENIEGEKLPASLIRLKIYDSPLLGKKCEMKDPQVWPKVSHIRKIQVDGTWI